ncbi:MAG: sigma-70 family RNA polymerase sigma factor [Alphaproteobacteria bacterium]|nr:sigma-70 family RNA polymerase sigma factor [Alphaproteobacteria bacterium]
MEDESDERLLAQIQKRDRQAFSVLVRRHSQRFYRMAWRISGTREEAEDIVQEAFLKLWDRPGLWKPGKGAAFTTWFARIVMNAAIDHVRRARNAARFSTLASAGDEAREDGMPQAQYSREQAALERALHALPLRQKAAIDLSYYEGLSNRDAAAVLGLRVKAFESLLVRARTSLRTHLTREGGNV